MGGNLGNGVEVKRGYLNKILCCLTAAKINLKRTIFHSQLPEF